MPRPLRPPLPGGLFHVTSRGCNKRSIYSDAASRELHLALLSQVVRAFGWRCHGYCQMDNHFHIVVETPAGNLSEGMQQLNGLYAQEFNHSVGRSGHLFQGRFHSVVIRHEPHLLQTERYVVLNRVRSGAADDPADWPWSSFPAMAGLVAVPSFLTTEWVLGRFGDPTSEGARARYRAFVGEGAPARTLRSLLALSEPPPRLAKRSSLVPASATP